MSTTIDESGCLQPRRGRFKRLRHLQLPPRLAILCAVVAIAFVAILAGPTAVQGQDTSDTVVAEPVGIAPGAGLYFDYWPSRNTRYSSRYARGVLGVGGWDDNQTFTTIGGVPLTVIQFDWVDRPTEFTRASLDREALASLEEEGAIEIVDEWEISTAADGSFSIAERDRLEPGMYLLLPDWGSRPLESMEGLTFQLSFPEIEHSIDDGDELSIIFQSGS